jgi:isoamylase
VGPQGGGAAQPAQGPPGPHATAISGDYSWGQADFAHDMNSPEEMNETDGAGSTPLCVVTADDFEWGDDQPRSPR